MGAPAPTPPRGKKRLVLSVLALLLLLVIAGGGVAAYQLTRPKPILNLTSIYAVGSMPAGAATTVFHIAGSQFAGNSAVSFLLDGKPEPGNLTIQSTSNGAIQGEMTVTTDWALGKHLLTAKDASGDVTLVGKSVFIVAQGEAGTPGPNGAPADDTPSFSMSLTVHAHSKDTGQDSSYPYSLVVTGQPDPAGGTVCSPGRDTNQPQSFNGTTSGHKYRETFVVQCSGTYKGGKITYTQTVTSDKVVYDTGLTCATTGPYVNQELDGSFTSATEVSGTLSSGAATFTCNNGRSGTSNGMDGTWSGSISS